jgi:hypothetical protein
MSILEKGPRVFVPQEPRFKQPDGSWKTVDMLQLLDYGSVEVLLEPGEQVTFNAASTVRRIMSKMVDYRADKDFVVAAGDPVAIGICCAIAAAAGRGKFKIAKWDRLERRYFIVPIDLISV